jgi:hypothetical protein
MAWTGLAMSALVGLWQTSALVQELTPQGQYSVAGLVGPGQVASFATPPYPTFEAWEQAGLTFGKLDGWLWYCLAFDAVLIVSIAALAVVVIRRYPQPGPAVGLTAAAICGFALEAIVGAASLLLRPHGALLSALVWLMHVVTIAKWIAVICLLTWVIYRVHASRQAYRLNVRDRGPDEDRSDQTGIYPDLRRLWNAVEVQRFSLIVVALLALIAIGPPLSDTLEQLPDVQRSWLNAGSLMGLRQMTVALIAELLIAILLFQLGRMRSKRADAKFAGTAEDSRKSLWHLPWLIVPAAIGVVALILSHVHQAHVAWPRFWAFFGTLTAIFAVSGFLVLFAGNKISRGRDQPPREAVISEAARIAGDALALAVLAITPIGLAGPSPLRYSPFPILAGNHLPRSGSPWRLRWRCHWLFLLSCALSTAVSRRAGIARPSQRGRPPMGSRAGLSDTASWPAALSDCGSPWSPSWPSTSR